MTIRILFFRVDASPAGLAFAFGVFFGAAAFPSGADTDASPGGTVPAA